MNVKELQEKMMNFSYSYFLPDLRKDKDDFYALTEQELHDSPICLGGYVLNLMMDGYLDKANEIIESLPENSFERIALTVVNPSIDWKEFIHRLNYLKRTGQSLKMVVLTAGRPQLLNGFNDFTRLGPMLEHFKDECIEDIQFLYGTECAPVIFNLSLAEYYYQKNKLIEVEMLVSSTIKEFDKKNEYRFLFTALVLQSKILLATGSILRSASYIKDINKQIRDLGKAEFSNNINAVEVMGAFYDGRYDVIANWMHTDAPDELGDFNMLDLYRYMVKIRCYIVLEKYSMAISLIEKLRPLLEIGRRPMDLCEIDLLLAMTLFAAGNKNLAFEALVRALKSARRRNYLRLVADEGTCLFPLLVEYVKEKGETPFLMEMIELTRKMAIQYPLYLKPRYQNKEQFTQMEVDILRLLQQGKSQEEIGDYFFISLNTVKYHLKKIYTKLEASSATQAIWKAKLIGLIR